MLHMRQKKEYLEGVVLGKPGRIKKPRLSVGFSYNGQPSEAYNAQEAVAQHWGQSAFSKLIPTVIFIAFKPILESYISTAVSQLALLSQRRGVTNISVNEQNGQALLRDSLSSASILVDNIDTLSKTATEITDKGIVLDVSGNEQRKIWPPIANPEPVDHQNGQPVYDITSMR